MPFIKESLLEAPQNQIIDESDYPLDDFEYLRRKLNITVSKNNLNGQIQNNATNLTLDQVVDFVRKDKKEMKQIYDWTNKFVAAGYDVYFSSFSEAMKQHANDKLISRCMGNVNYSHSSHPWGMYMAGVALIATYLKRKHNLNNLHVCETLAAFKNKLKEIASSQNDVKAALIIPIHQHPDEPKRSDQHKITVGIEKIGAKMKIVILDSFGENKQILSFISNTKLLKNVEYYTSCVGREVPYGCETFAILDSVNFSKESQFLQGIKI